MWRPWQCKREKKKTLECGHSRKHSWNGHSLWLQLFTLCSDSVFSFAHCLIDRFRFFFSEKPNNLKKGIYHQLNSAKILSRTVLRWVNTCLNILTVAENACRWGFVCFLPHLHIHTETWESVPAGFICGCFCAHIITTLAWKYRLMWWLNQWWVVFCPDCM